MSHHTSQPWMKRAEEIAIEAYGAATSEPMRAVVDALAAAGYLRMPGLLPAEGETTADVPIFNELKRLRAGLEHIQTTSEQHADEFRQAGAVVPTRLLDAVAAKASNVLTGGAA
jgi:hypothetical protein